MFFKLLRSFGPFLREIFLGDQTVIQALGSNKSKAVTALIIAGLVFSCISLLGQLSTLTRKYALLSQEYITLHANMEKLTSTPKKIEIAPVAVVEKTTVIVAENKKPTVKVIAKSTPDKSKETKDDKETEKRYRLLKQQYETIKAREEKE